MFCSGARALKFPCSSIPAVTSYHYDVNPSKQSLKLPYRDSARRLQGDIKSHLFISIMIVQSMQRRPASCPDSFDRSTETSVPDIYNCDSQRHYSTKCSKNALLLRTPSLQCIAMLYRFVIYIFNS